MAMSETGKQNRKQSETKSTMTIKDIQNELGVSRKVATAWSKQYLHYKLIGRRYIFSRKEFIQAIEQPEDVEYQIKY